jgi:hypothetical protein
MAVGVLDPRKGIVWQDDGSSLTPEQIEQLQALEIRRRMGGVDTSPVNHWSQGAARVVDALGGVLRERRLANAAAENQQYNQGLASPLIDALGGGSSPTASAATSGVAQEMASTSPAPVVAEGEIADYIRQSATARGIDPDIALRVAMSEGGLKDPVRQSNVVKNGVREASYGPFQLYMGGGLGNKALEAGIDPRDPNQWRQGVDFALDQAAKGGWSPWYGAAKVGVGNRTGLDNARAIGFSPQAAASPAAAAIEQAAPASGYVDPMVSAPNALPSQASSFDASRFGEAPAGIAPEIYSQPSDVPPLPAATNIAPTPAVATAPQQPMQVAQNSVPPAALAQALRVMADPRANQATKQVAEVLIRRQQAQEQAAQEQAVWMQRQQYEQQQQANDPYRQLQIRKAEQELASGARQPLVNAGDGRIYDPNAGTWITAPDAASRNFRQATPDEVKAFGTNGQVGPDGKFYPITPPQGTALSVDPNTGAVTFNQGAGVKPLTEGQSKDSFFTTRMTAALPTLEANEAALLNLGEKAAGAAPLGMGNYMQSEEYQLARDAGRDFVTAYLRKDSGAALTPSEEKIYGELLLPQPGDKPATIELKKQRRQVAVEAIKSGMPPQALDGVIKAIKAVPGADQPVKSNRTSSGVEWSLD